MREVTVFATDGPMDIEVHGYDDEGNDRGPVGNGWNFTDFATDPASPEIFTAADEGHGSITIDPGAPVGYGERILSFNGHAGDGPNVPGSIKITVLPGTVSSLG